MTIVVLPTNDDPPPEDTAEAETAPISDDADAYRTEQRRMWCLQQAIGVSLSALRMAPTAPMVDITKTAEEMAEFIETGVARTHKDTPRTKQ